MKIYCEHCEKEITDEELVSTEHGAFHEEDCFMEHCYMQYATTFTLDAYKVFIQKLEARIKEVTNNELHRRNRE